MTDVWKLQDAKNKLSELVERTKQFGPQRITRRGRPVAVLLSEEEYEKLTGTTETLLDFFRKSPLCGISLNITRDKTPPRDVDLCITL